MTAAFCVKCDAELPREQLVEVEEGEWTRLVCPSCLAPENPPDLTHSPDVDTSAPFTRRITCNSCGHEGVVEAHDTVGKVSDKDIFALLGKDSEGYVRFRCPSCETHVAVDPLEWMSQRGSNLGTPSPEAERDAVSSGQPVHGLSPGQLLYRRYSDEMGSRNPAEILDRLADDYRDALGRFERPQRRVRQNQMMALVVIGVLIAILLYAC